MSNSKSDDAIGRAAGKRAFEKLQDELNGRPKVGGNYLRKLATRIDQGVDAQETRLFAHQGVVMDSRDLIDHRTRGLFVKLAVEIFGATAPAQHEIAGANGAPILVIHEKENK